MNTPTLLPSRPRSSSPSSFPCPHCLTGRPRGRHYLDAGTLTPEAALAAGYCPELARLRNR